MVFSFKVWNGWTQVPSVQGCEYVSVMQTMRPAVSKIFIIFLVFHKQIIKYFEFLYGISDSQNTGGFNLMWY